jgi:tetratricopeptide (TPR) repeat protein
VRLIALLLAVVVGSAQDNDYAIGLLRQWIIAVGAHEPGESDAALATITAWSYNDLELMRPYVEALVDAPLKNNRNRTRRRTLLDSRDQQAIAELAKLQVPRDLDRFKKRAALLHTDAALLGPPPVIAPPPDRPFRRPRWASEQAERGVNVKSFDGRVEGYELKNLHWDFAMDILDALPAVPSRDPAVAQWYRAIGAYLSNRRQFADAMVHFAHARTVVPDDPRVMFGEASVQESLGAPRTQNYVKVTTLPNGMVFLGVDSPATHWRRAEQLLRRAIALDPKYAEARLRLGRISILLQRYEEGLQLVQQAAGELKDSPLIYYAYLFAGDAQQSLSRTADALVSYGKALELYPDSQAARLGLGSALRMSGDHAKALEALLPTLTNPSTSRADDDPWWIYYDGDGAHADALLGELRTQLRGPRQ